MIAARRHEARHPSAAFGVDAVEALVSDRIMVGSVGGVRGAEAGRVFFARRTNGTGRVRKPWAGPSSACAAA
ncbi:MULTISPECIES: hypothetical protein [unclassified Methylobacterium]|uniref:hypothetical protein n=1 Tax=unclassified Methylobacterium TaxID=2615210 RepID=UPI0011C1E10D|nr:MULTISPECIES: hypothetical protein [unclassified Methylobacterium]QEE38851.1 hypothetical protein FVA80_07625 [Methylobacterium sp. WL1]TXN53603.1 hypothetical protein FV241_27550 [Methylobacterium sp. WL2]